jgi:hypothetical protein
MFHGHIEAGYHDGTVVPKRLAYGRGEKWTGVILFVYDSSKTIHGID